MPRNGVVRVASSASSNSSGSGSSKHVRCIGRYVLIGTNLGKGNFARVEAAVHTLTRSKVAIKIIETDKIREEYVRKNLLREAQLMRRLRHPNIIRLYETMKTSNLYCLVMEVAEGGELLSFVRNDFKEKRLPEATTRPFVRQLVSALHHLHSSGIVHRDLKMENIMLDKKKKQVKIVDFGLSNAQAPGSLLQTHCGSPEYAAPELFIPGREYGPEVDVWSLGVNMYAMLVGKLPFRSPRQGSKKRQKLLEQIQAGLTDGREKDMSHVTPEGRDLIGKLLQPNPKERVKLTEVMQHPWITKDGSQPLYPYKYTSPDQATQKSVMELMSTFLEVSQSEIKEAVRRDRCDWMAAIYNLLIDQPDGRVVMQRLLSSAPEDQLEDAAHYQGQMEHLRLSQDAGSETTPPDVTHALTAAVATGTHSRVGYRHSFSGDASSTEAHPPSTLPLKKKRHRHEATVPQQPLNPINPPPLRRMSIATAQVVPSYPGDRISGLNVPQVKGGRKLPPTPTDPPYTQDHHHPPPSSSHHHHPHRPHSRAESEPNPLPLPWRPALVQRSSGEPGSEGGAYAARQSLTSPPPSHLSASINDGSHGNQAPLMSPLAQMGVVSKKRASKGVGLRPVSGGHSLNKRISTSVDTNLDIRAGGGGGGGGGDVPPPSLHPPLGRLRSGGYRVQLLPHDHVWGTLSRRSRDIQGMMKVKQPVTSPYSSVQDISLVGVLGDGGGGGGGGGRGSIISVDIKPELFNGGRVGEAWSGGHDGVSPYSSRVSPLGSAGTSPYGSTTVSPYGSRAVSPHHHPIAEGSKVNPRLPLENGVNSLRHHRYSSSRRGQSSGHPAATETETLNGPSHHGGYHDNRKPPHHLVHLSDEQLKIKRKSKSHTHSERRGLSSPEQPNYLTEL